MLTPTEYNLVAEPSQYSSGPPGSRYVNGQLRFYFDDCPSNLPDNIPVERGKMPAAEVADHSTRRRLTGIAAVVLAGTLFAGLSADSQSSPDKSPVSMSQPGIGGIDTYEPPIGQDARPSLQPGELGRVEADVYRALTVDTCGTKVSPTEVISMYGRLFGEDTKPSSNPYTFQKQAEQVSGDFVDAHSKLHFGTFPDVAYDLLYHDVFSEDPKLPLADYQKVVAGYLAERGVTAVFDWQRGAPGAPDDKMIRPANNVANKTDVMARKVYFAALRDSAYIPREMVDRTHTKRVVFGDIVDEKALGQVVLDGPDIYIETNMFKDTDRDPLDPMSANAGFMASILTHEITHHLQDGLCYAVGGQYAPDASLRSLNDGMVYTADTADKTVTPGFTSLDLDGPGTMVVAYSEGFTNDMEDWATIGQTCIYGPTASRIYKHDGIDEGGQYDKVPLREKVALFMTRIGHNSSAVGDYLVRMIQFERYRAASQEKMTELWFLEGQLPHENPDLREQGQVSDTTVANKEYYMKLQKLHELADKTAELLEKTAAMTEPTASYK